MLAAELPEVEVPSDETPDVCNEPRPVLEQCGGQGWSGDTCCEAGSTCVVQNRFYSQCLPECVLHHFQDPAMPGPHSSALHTGRSSPILSRLTGMCSWWHQTLKADLSAQRLMPSQLFNTGIVLRASVRPR